MSSILSNISSLVIDVKVEKRNLSLTKNNIHGGRDQSTWILRGHDKQKEDNKKKYEQMRNVILQKVDYIKQKEARMTKEKALSLLISNSDHRHKIANNSRNKHY